jgi:hypothetical protein
MMCGASNWISDHKKELEIGAGVLGTALTAGMLGPALLGAGGAAAGAGAAGASGAGAAAGLGGGAASLFGGGAADAGLASSLLNPAVTPTLAQIAGDTGAAAGAGMGGGTASLFGAGQLAADQVGPSTLGELKAGLQTFNNKIQPFAKGISAAQKVMGPQQTPAPMPMQRPPSMTQPQNQQSSAQILGGQGPSAQIAGALPPGSQKMTPEMLALLLKMQGYA